jgi:predicted secreted protein
MVAESVPARRPVLSFLLCVVFVVGSAVLAGAPARASEAALSRAAASVTTSSVTTSPAGVRAATAADAVTVTLAPAGSPVLAPGQDLPLTVTVTNGTTTSLAAGSVDVYLAARALTTRTTLDNWLRPDDGSPGDLILSQPTVSAILPGTAETISLTVPAASVGLTAHNAWGARGVAATFSTGGAVSAEGRSTFIWSPGTPVAPVNVAMVMPITTPAGSAGIIPSQALETYTGATGLLTRQLDGVINRPVAIAIDPMIIASIRVLGTAAPASAVEWLDRLAHAANDIFPLGYADADLALEVQAGATALLAPTSFDQAIDPANFSTPTPQPSSPTGIVPPTGSATETPTPEPTGTPGAPPTAGELLAWNYTSTSIAWPAEGTVAAPDLHVFAAGGLTTTIVAGSQVSTQNADDVPNAAINLGDSVGLVIDDPLSNALRKAAKATTDDDWREAMAEAMAQLAVVAAEDPGSGRTLLAAFDRGWPSTSARLSQTVDALSALPWETPASLQQTLASPRTPNATFQGKAEPDARVDQAARLLDREGAVAAFASVAADPTAITGTHRLDLLALLANAWAPQPDAWHEAVTNSLASSGALLQSISVTTKGPINVLASQVDIPVTLSNSLSQAVTVRVHLMPSNGRLVVESDIEATLNAESAQTVKVPVSAKVGNGDVTLQVSVFSSTGVVVGVPSLVDVNVQAEWEGVGAVIFAVLVVLFFGFGIWRNIVRRRKELTDSGSVAGPGADDARADSDTPTDAGADDSGRSHG